MADNVTPPGFTGPVATDGVTYSGDAAAVQLIRIVDVAGAEGGKTVQPHGLATEASLSEIASAVHLEDTAHTTGDAGIFALAVRRDGETTLATPDGDYAPLTVNPFGRLKVSAVPGFQDPVTANITSNTGTVAIDVARTSNIAFHCVNTGVTGATFNWEASLNSTNGTDGNWFAVQAVQTNANTIGTSATGIGATPTFGWEASVNGYRWFRVRASAGTFGTSTWTIQPAPYATEPIPAQQVSGTQPVSFTQPALVAGAARIGFVASAGIWYDDSSTALAANATFTGASRDATVTATATAFANAATYADEVRVSAESDVAGTLWVEFSRDNVAWRRMRSVATAAVAGGGQSAEIIFRPSWRYWRVGYTNGATIQARFTVGSIAKAS